MKKPSTHNDDLTMKKGDNKNQEDKGWELPHPIKLNPQQRAFLRSYYSPPTNLDPKTLLPELKRQIETSSPLAKRRFQDPEWLKTNLTLYQKAVNGDERAFHELVYRDPRYLCSDLGLFFIAGWQSAIDSLYALGQTEGSILQFEYWINKAGAKNYRSDRRADDLNAVRDLIEANKKQLGQLSIGLIKPFEGWRSHPTATASHIHAYYRASVILFHGLKQAAKSVRFHREKIRRMENCLGLIARVTDDQIKYDTKEGFLIYIRAAACLYMTISKAETLKRAKSTQVSQANEICSEFSAYAVLTNSPARLAESFVGKLFGIGSRTVAKYAKSSFLITWPSADRKKIFSATKLIARLEDYEALRDILCNKP
jgi:hypothetical protein